MKQIDSYFYDHDSSPLRMVDSKGSTPSLPIITNLDDLVLWVIKAAASCSTYDDTDYQCRAGASRSSGDIWRIIKHYRDDVSVLQVIAAMVRLAQEHRIGLMKCYDIGKYVCYSDIYGSFHEPPDACQCDEDDDYDFECSCGRGNDEYGMDANDWYDIADKFPNVNLEVK